MARCAIDGRSSPGGAVFAATRWKQTSMARGPCLFQNHACPRPLPRRAIAAQRLVAPAAVLRRRVSESPPPPHRQGGVDGYADARRVVSAVLATIASVALLLGDGTAARGARAGLVHGCAFRLVFMLAWEHLPHAWEGAAAHGWPRQRMGGSAWGQLCASMGILTMRECIAAAAAEPSEWDVGPLPPPSQVAPIVQSTAVPTERGTINAIRGTKKLMLDSGRLYGDCSQLLENTDSTLSEDQRALLQQIREAAGLVRTCTAIKLGMVAKDDMSALRCH
eukprot:59758-Chlamydomonas_euryale.AAC.2